MLEVARNLIAPASNAYTCGAQRIKRTNGAVWLDKPAVLQRISKQEHASSSGGRHRRIEKTDPGAFCRSSGHMAGAFLLLLKMDKGAPLEPQLARPTQRDLLVGVWVRHDEAWNCSLMTAPIRFPWRHTCHDMAHLVLENTPTLIHEPCATTSYVHIKIG